MQWEDHLAVRRLKHEYCHTIDGGEYEEWVALFTEDGRFERAGSDAFEGADELLTMATEDFDPAFEQTAHVVANPVVDVDVDTADGRWYLFLLYRTADGDVGWNQGLYEDRFRRVDGQWRIEDVAVTFGVSSP